MAAATGNGTGAVKPAVTVRAPASGVGASTVAAAARIAAAASGSGTATVTPVTFTNMGMQKSGDVTYSNFGSATTLITNWTPADANSTVTSNGLGPATGNGVRTVTLAARMTSVGGGVATMQVLKNGSSIGSMSPGTSVTTQAFPNVTINAGDVFTVTMTYTGNGYNRTLIAADTSLSYS
jgi:hypothetical protein